jgi:hypothetical protein
MTVSSEFAAIDMLAGDNQFTGRVRVSITKEEAAGTIRPLKDDPVQTAWDYRYHIAAGPGFGQAYKYALETGVPNPGQDNAVISDAQITAQVQTVFAPIQIPETPDQQSA